MQWQNFFSYLFLIVFFVQNQKILAFGVINMLVAETHEPVIIAPHPISHFLFPVFSCVLGI